MMSTFNHKPIEEILSDDDDDGIDSILNMVPQKGKRKIPSTTQNSRKPKQKRDSDSDDTVVRSRKSARSVDIEDEDDTELFIPSRIISSVASRATSLNNEVNIKIPSSDFNVIEKKAVELQKIIESTKSNLTRSVSLPVDSAKIGNNVPIARSYTTTRVMTAEERMREASKLQRIPEAHSIDPTIPSRTEEAPNLKCVTRLNGHHVTNWNVASSESFAKFRERIASLYGISKAILKVKFDGNNLKDNETFESAGIEDDDMIDLEIDKALFPDAVVKAEEKLKSNKSLTNSVDFTAPPKTTETTNLKCVTRLNGSHIIKWKVSSTDTIAKFRERIASFYDISKTNLKIQFDGKNLKDGDTFESAGIEDEDMIDLKLDKELHKIAAITAVQKQGLSTELQLE